MGPAHHFWGSSHFFQGQLGRFFSLAEVVNACAKAARWQQALQVVLRGVGPPDGSALNVAQYTTVLNACGRGWCVCCVGFFGGVDLIM